MSFPKSAKKLRLVIIGTLTLVDKVEMERAYGHLEKSHMTLTSNYNQLQKDKEVVQKSRDQKDKHLAVIYRGTYTIRLITHQI